MTPGRDASQPNIRLRELELRSQSERVLKGERHGVESEFSGLVESRDTIPDGLEPAEGPGEWYERTSDTIPAAPMSAAPDTLPTVPHAARLPSFAELAADLVHVGTNEPLRPTVLPGRERGKG